MNTRTTTPPSLCFPDSEKTCFACCPPIRPAGYEHIDYRSIIQRILRENNRDVPNHLKGLKPITGFSCWALGYLDPSRKLIGCLLHPKQNNGKDLRYQVDYGTKCEREICPESKIFSKLAMDEQMFWLQLTSGLDSFSFSSRKLNPLFSLVNWGTRLLRMISIEETGRHFTRESFFQTYPFFMIEVSPRANAYLINKMIASAGTGLLKDKSSVKNFLNFSSTLSGKILTPHKEGAEEPFVHRLNLDREFSDFLRLSMGIRKLNQDGAIRVKIKVDEEIKKFLRKLNFV